MNRIVIGTDGSPGARAAAAEGIELARRCGVPVVLVAVRPGIPLLGEPYYQRRLSEQLEHARTAVADAEALAAAAGVPVETEIVEGEPADEILRIARHHDADLIVVGSRGLGALAGTLLGSISHRLVHHSPVTVLVVKERPPSAAPAADAPGAGGA